MSYCPEASTLDSGVGIEYTSRMLPHRLHLCLIPLLLIAAAGCAAFAAGPEKWIELRSSNFIAVTNGNEKQARRAAYQFELIRAVFREFFNLQGSGTDPPVIVIAAKDQNTFKALLPEYDWTKKGSMHLGGTYLPGPEKNYVALRLDIKLSPPAHQGTTLSYVALDKLRINEKLSSEPYGDFEPVYHEYVHFLMRQMMSPMPLWMVEGLAEFYGNTQVDNTRVWLGVPSDSNLEVLRQTLPLPQSPPLSLDTLFRVDASSPSYHEDNRASIFYAESWALTHYLITRDGREHTHHVADFVALLGKNVAPDEAARRTLGDPNALQQALGEYIRQSTFTAARWDSPANVHENQYGIHAISEAESLAVRADFMARDLNYAQAQGMLEKTLKLNPALASAHESMGFLCTQHGKLDEANKWYSQAVALNPQSYLGHYLYAVNLLKGKLDGDSASQAESSLRAAIKINPGFAPAYDRLGWLLASRPENAEKPEKLNEADKMAMAAVSLEPGNIYYRLDSAEVLERMGRVDDAVEVAHRVAATAQTPDEQTAAQAVLTSAQEYRDYQKQIKDQQKGAEKARALSPLEAGKGSKPGSDSLPPQTVVLTKHSPRPELLPSLQMVEGTIKDCKCSGASTLELALSSSTGEIQLYSDSYPKIPYSALNYTPKGILDPCADLEDRHARITYHPAKSQLNQGEIVAVVLVKD